MIYFISSWLFWGVKGYIGSKIWHVFVTIVDNEVRCIFRPRNKNLIGYRWTEANLLSYFDSII